MLLHASQAAPPKLSSVGHRRTATWLRAGTLIAIWALVYLASLASPPLLDDADATHAQAAQAMLRTGDWVTLHVDGIRYLEKAPLPYWIAALSLRVFGNNSFAVHLPLALTVLGLATLAWIWGERAFDPRTGFYAALFTLTGAGTFLFTRVFIPDALLSLLLGCVLYFCSRALEGDELQPLPWALAAWLALAAAVLTKGFVALVFCFGAVAGFLLLTRATSQWKRLYPGRGSLLFLAIAAPWHVLAGLRNRGAANDHGFFWFYFINEHVLRFLGRRLPADYNKLPAALYWSLHLVWLFPWSFFAPVALWFAWSSRTSFSAALCRKTCTKTELSALFLVVFSSFVLIFFAFSTNQEYYTFPVYMPLMLLLAAGLARMEQQALPAAHEGRGRHVLIACQAALMVLGIVIAVALAIALWSSRHLPASPDIGDLFVRRGVGDYTLSMSHFFDLTAASFSALRLPAALACVAFALGPALSLVLRLRRMDLAATLTLVCSSTLFLVAAHVALVRFAPMLSSERFAATIERLQGSGAISPYAEVLLFGDQAFGSSIPFYLQREVKLVDGRSTSMLFGSTFPDAAPIFETHADLQASWGNGPRKILFVPLEHHDEVHQLLGSRTILLQAVAGKELLTDRPLSSGRETPSLDTNTARPEQ